MKKQSILFSLLTVLTLLSVTAKAQVINIDAALQYWQLTDSLRKDRPVTDEQWKQFIAMEGNKTYVRSVFDSASIANYRKAVEMVYMPKQAARLQKNLAAKYWYAILVQRYKDKEDSLKTYLQNNLASPAYSQVMYDKVYQWLPKKARHQIPGIKFFYNALGMDAVSYSNGIFISAMAAFQHAKIGTGILEAHEMHHQLRPQKALRKPAAAHQGILYAIRSIQNEGIADMIDKEPTYTLPGDPEEIGDWLIKPAPEAIRKLDSALVVMARTDSHTFEDERYYRQVLRSSAGHMPGFHMARTIVRNGYRKQMIKHADDPFAFIYLYHKAAKKDDTRPAMFSPEAIVFLKRLEKLYAE